MVLLHSSSRAPELRAAIARSGQKIYQVAAAAQVHPSHLSAMLHGRVPLPDSVADRVLRIVEDHPAPKADQ